jgi:UDP-N-acetylmuramoylalanine--D-glutamate ligase
MESRAYKDKNIALFGLGKSGLATALALTAGGARLSVWDDNPERRMSAKKAGLNVVDFVNGEWPLAEYLVLSPGVPLTHPTPHPVVLKAQAAGAKIIGDIEIFLAEKPNAMIVGITGTNGKSTTAALVYHMLKSANRSVALGGNIGTPAMELEALSEDGIYVLELSSYQLDLTPSWKADIAVLLNITPDHLDRHGDMDGYVKAKSRIFQNQTSDDKAIICTDNNLCRILAEECNAEVIPVSTQEMVKDGVYVLEGMLNDETSWLRYGIDLSKAQSLRGQHNWENAAIAVAVARTLGLTAVEIRDGLLSFPGLAHRMELVAVDGNVSYVNDSKATNAEAAEKALLSYNSIYWIAGGLEKAGGISSLAYLFPKIRRAYLIGECAENFAAAMEENFVAVELSGDLKTATLAAAKAAHEDGLSDSVVLLSPAAASFDQFPSFEARGDQFREIVQDLQRRVS